MSPCSRSPDCGPDPMMSLVPPWHPDSASCDHPWACSSEAGGGDDDDSDNGAARKSVSSCKTKGKFKIRLFEHWENKSSDLNMKKMLNCKIQRIQTSLLKLLPKQKSNKEIKEKEFVKIWLSSSKGHNLRMYSFRIEDD